MSKKDYVIVALALYKSKPCTTGNAAWDTWSDTVYNLAMEFKRTNKKFDPARFAGAAYNGG